MASVLEGPPTVFSRSWQYALKYFPNVAGNEYITAQCPSFPDHNGAVFITNTSEIHRAKLPPFCPKTLTTHSNLFLPSSTPFAPVLSIHSRSHTTDAIEVTEVTLLSSAHGCRFCRANREELCRQSGSGCRGWLNVF